MKYFSYRRPYQGTLFIVFLTLLFATFNGCNYGGFQKNEAGLTYNFIQHNPEKPNPEIGDILDLSVKYFVADSLVFDNRFFLSLDSARHNGGSIETGLAMLNVGDSAVFKLQAKSFYEFSLRRPYPENFKNEDELRFEVKLHGFKTKAEIERERKAIFNRNKLEEEKEITVYIEEQGIATDSPSGLYVSQIKGGTGKRITPGKKVTVHYTGAFLTGQVFDSSLNRNLPFTFVFGTGEVITAWEMGLKDAQVGDKIQIITPSWYAYEDKGVEGVIPPNTPLVFEIEILDAE